MLKSFKQVSIAAAAALGLLLATTAAPSVAVAAKADQKAQSDHGKRHVAKKKVVKKKVVHKKVVHKTVVNKRVVHRDHRYVARSTAQTVGFVVIGPRTVYRAYGNGWCRALHRGRHWAPGAGWHSGRHVGRVRC